MIVLFYATYRGDFMSFDRTEPTSVLFTKPVNLCRINKFGYSNFSISVVIRCSRKHSKRGNSRPNSEIRVHAACSAFLDQRFVIRIPEFTCPVPINWLSE